MLSGTVIGLVVSGCVLGSSRSSGVLDQVVPSPNQQLGCENTGIDGPNGRSCTLIVKGTEADVVRRIASSLKRRGYETQCTDSGLVAGGVEVVGGRPGMRVTADVIPAGFALMVQGDAIFYPPGTSVSGKTVDIPSGSVGVKIDASEYQATPRYGKSCTGLMR